MVERKQVSGSIFLRSPEPGEEWFPLPVPSRPGSWIIGEDLFIFQLNQIQEPENRINTIKLRRLG